MFAVVKKSARVDTPTVVLVSGIKQHDTSEDIEAFALSEAGETKESLFDLKSSNHFVDGQLVIKFVLYKD